MWLGRDVSALAVKQSVRLLVEEPEMSRFLKKSGEAGMVSEGNASHV